MTSKAPLKKKVTLSQDSAELIAQFGKSAMAWGCEEEFGNGKAVGKAEKVYLADKGDLEAHVLKLENKIKRLQAKAREGRQA